MLPVLPVSVDALELLVLVSVDVLEPLVSVDDPVPSADDALVVPVDELVVLVSPDDVPDALELAGGLAGADASPLAVDPPSVVEDGALLAELAGVLLCAGALPAAGGLLLAGGALLLAGGALLLAGGALLLAGGALLLAGGALLLSAGALLSAGRLLLAAGALGASGVAAAVGVDASGVGVAASGFGADVVGAAVLCDPEPLDLAAAWAVLTGVAWLVSLTDTVPAGVEVERGVDARSTAVLTVAAFAAFAIFVPHARPEACWPRRLLISESIFEPAPIAPGG